MRGQNTKFSFFFRTLRLINDSTCISVFSSLSRYPGVHGAQQVVDDLICMMMSYMCDLSKTLFNGILEPLNDGDHSSLVNNEA
jgi:hypothetical protein